MAEPQTDKPPEKESLPLFAQYLSHPDTPYDCWFHVGDPDKTKPEKIGGSKLNLMAHSELFRRMLHESPLAEKGPITVTDIEPATFKLLLRFIHGYYEVKDLSFEEAVALLCAAEKYFVHNLRKRLGDHITSLLTVNNVFLPLTKLECCQEETLKNAMEKIVQEETKQLVAGDKFLQLNTDGILVIVTQKCLQITEVELWKAVLDWAKYQAGSEDINEVRKLVSEPMQHIRFCTMNSDDFIKEVVATGILTDIEILSVVKVRGGKIDCEKCAHICYELTSRVLFSSENLDNARTIEFNYKSGFSSVSHQNESHSYMYLTTAEIAVHLLSADFISQEHPFSKRYVPKGLTAQVKCKVSLIRITDYKDDTSTEQPIEFECEKVVLYGTRFSFSFGQNLKLLPMNKYKLTFTFGGINVNHLITQNKGCAYALDDGGTVSWNQDDNPRTHCYSLYYKYL